MAAGTPHGPAAHVIRRCTGHRSAPTAAPSMGRRQCESPTPRCNPGHQTARHPAWVAGRLLAEPAWREVVSDRRIVSGRGRGCAGTSTSAEVLTMSRNTCQLCRETRYFHGTQVFAAVEKPWAGSVFGRPVGSSTGSHRAILVDGPGRMGGAYELVRNPRKDGGGTRRGGSAGGVRGRWSGTGVSRSRLVRQRPVWVRIRMPEHARLGRLGAALGRRLGPRLGKR
jgi:hypothetical protein